MLSFDILPERTIMWTSGTIKIDSPIAFVDQSETIYFLNDFSSRKES